MKFARCQFCGDTFDSTITGSEKDCAKCIIIDTYDSKEPEQYFKAMNRVTELILKKRFNTEYTDPYSYLDAWGPTDGRKGFDIIAKGIADIRKKAATMHRIVTAIKEILPSDEICKGFRNLCTNKSVQDAVNMLSRHYQIPIMKTVFYEFSSSDKICKNARAVYYTAELAAYFDKTGYSQTTILHEFYHHLVNVGVAFAESDEQEEYLADEYAKQFAERGLKE
jgi:hypothetical protein